MSDEIKLEWHNERRKIKDLIPHPNNPRQLTEQQAKVLTKSLEKFNLVEIPAIDTDNTLLAGHQRMKIMLLLGRGNEEIDVRVPNRKLTQEEADSYNILSNKATGEWDYNILANWTKICFLELNKGFDLNLKPEEGEDEVPEVDASTAPIAQLADVWQLGRHRLMCGDSTKPEDVDKLMDAQKADMVFTDPPYNVDYEGMQNSKQWDKIANDKMSDADFISFLEKAFKNFYDFTKPEAAMYVCHADKSHKEFRDALEKIGYCWRATIIWAKNSPAYNFAQYKYAHEPIFYCFKNQQTVKWYGDNTQKTVFKEDWSNEKILKWFREKVKQQNETGETTVWEAKKEHGDHPTIKPVELINKAILNSSQQNDIVLDLFGGSGSTLIACQKTNRLCRMMEIDQHYCDVIIARWEKMTGQKAMKLMV